MTRHTVIPDQVRDDQNAGRSQPDRGHRLDQRAGVGGLRLGEHPLGRPLFLDPARADGVGVLHEWESPEHFAFYLASPQFSGSGSLIRPLMTAPPVSKRFHATPVEMAN